MATINFFYKLGVEIYHTAFINIIEYGQSNRFVEANRTFTSADEKV